MKRRICGKGGAAVGNRARTIRLPEPLLDRIDRGSSTSEPPRRQERSNIGRQRPPQQGSLPVGGYALLVTVKVARVLMDDDQKQRPESLLPYEKWIEQALRHVVAQAIEHAAVQGLPGGHHFYITFRTDQAGVALPARVKAQYPKEMTIVLQHQFWDLGFNRDTQAIEVGLSFGGVPTKLVIPLDAVVEFADPHIRYGLRFQMPEAPAEAEAPLPPPSEPETAAAKEAEPGQVVSLDAFRRRTSQD
jgi:hypothetical protein